MTTFTTRRAAAVLLIIALLGAWSIASAQIDSGGFQIFQNGSVVGVIYVPDHLNPSLYAEHWVLFANYVYPNARNLVKTTIVPDASASYTSETDFFRRAPWGTGYRYVYVASHDVPTVLPQ